MTHDPSATPPAADTTNLPRVGRKRDPTRDRAILDAAINVLAEVGYQGLTMDRVAAKAHAGKATLYRRWPSKSALLMDAMLHLRDAFVDLEHLPDTGSVTGDLMAVFAPAAPDRSERRLRAMIGLALAIHHDPALAHIGDQAIIAPWADAVCCILERGITRDEIPRPADMETLSRLLPSMAVSRALVENKPTDRAFLATLIDGILIPALRGQAQATT